jgi:hypothetical protein
MTEQTIPTWGYHARQPARVFELKPGEALPKGWRDRPLAHVPAKWAPVRRQEHAPTHESAADEPAAEPVAPKSTARKGRRHA